jgi:rhodanese-related sulfurtransferase
MRRLIVLFALVLSLAVALPAFAQVPAAVQEAVLSYLTIIASDYNTISAAALKSRLDAGEKVFVLDVREADEFAAGRVATAVNIPIRTIQQNLDKLPAKDVPIAVICRSGIRAAYVTMALRILGWKDARDMTGGMLEWEKQGFATVK